MAASRVAVVYATNGGMGDVGKFVAAAAVKGKASGNLSDVRIIAMSGLKKEGSDPRLFDVDVTQEDVKADLKSTLQPVLGDVTYIDVDAADAQQQLEGALSGMDAVIACLGSRQPGVARWCATGTRLVTAAMATNEVKRLALLSSFGIGNDFVKPSSISRLWGCLLHTVFRSTRKDLIELERIVEQTGLDYVLVRPTGLTPDRAPRGEWQVLQRDEDREIGVDMAIAKADVAAFMLQEAMQPSSHRTAVTVGHKLQKPE